MLLWHDHSDSQQEVNDGLGVSCYKIKAKHLAPPSGLNGEYINLAGDRMFYKPRVKPVRQSQAVNKAHRIFFSTLGPRHYIYAFSD